MTRAVQSFVGQPPSSFNAVCEVRMEILDKLASSIQALGQAKLELIEADSAFFEAVQFEVQQLRLQCSGLRGELEAHRSQHGC